MRIFILYSWRESGGTGSVVPFFSSKPASWTHPSDQHEGPLGWCHWNEVKMLKHKPAPLTSGAIPWRGSRKINVSNCIIYRFFLRNARAFKKNTAERVVYKKTATDSKRECAQPPCSTQQSHKEAQRRTQSRKVERMFLKHKTSIVSDPDER